MTSVCKIKIQFSNFDKYLQIEVISVTEKIGNISYLVDVICKKYLLNLNYDSY